MPLAPMAFDGGYVSSKPDFRLSENELDLGTGAYYDLNSTGAIKKIWGRSSFGDTGSGVTVQGIALCQFDSGGTDRLLARSGTVIYSATPGVSGSFSSFITGLSSMPSPLSRVHVENRWYLATGFDQNRVVESGGATRLMGMQPPQGQTTVSSISGVAANVTRPTTSSGTFTNASKAFDPDKATCATGTVLTPGTSKTMTVSTWLVSDTSSNRTVNIRYRLNAGVPPINNALWGVNGAFGYGFHVDYAIEKSENGGSSFTTLVSSLDNKRPMASFADIFSPLTGNNTSVQIRFTINYASNQITTWGEPVTLEVYDVNINNGGELANFSTTTGMFYGVTEYDSTRGEFLLESAPGKESTLVTMTNQNQVVINLPTSPSNPNSTHYVIYRTTDGGVWPFDAGRIGVASVSDTTFTDRFTFPKDSPALPYLDVISITAPNGTGELPFYTKGAPTVVDHLNVYKGALVGVKNRALFYSESVFAEYWPACNVVTSFPLAENDTLVATATVGDSLLIFCKGSVLRMDDLPRLVNGNFNNTTVSVIRGAPGAVGQYGIKVFSVSGEPRVAWVSPHGVFETNGFVVSRMSQDLSWSSEVSIANLATAKLDFDPTNQLMTMDYDATGAGYNNRFFTIHLGEEHRKQDTPGSYFGGKPKWSGPHYRQAVDSVGNMVGNIWKHYTAGRTGVVYYEKGSTTDASQSFSGTTVPMTLKTGKKYGDDRFVELDYGYLRTAPQSADTVTVTIAIGDDMSAITETIVNTVTLGTPEESLFYVARAGEWFTIQIDHTGTTQPELTDLRLFVRPMGRTGKVLTT